MSMSRRTVWISLFLALVLCSGCASHTASTVTPPPNMPAEFSTPQPHRPVGPMPEHWWRAFHDPVLNSLMATAFDGNLDLAQAAARLQQALGLSRQRQADRLPAANLTADAGRSRQLGATGPTTGTSWHVAAVAGYEVDLFDKIGSLAKAQAGDTAATREELHAAYLTISAQVAITYYLMVEQRARLVLIDQTVTARADNLSLIEARYQEGMASTLELYQARQSLAAARSRRPSVEATLGTAANALSVLTGGYPTQTIGGDLADLPDMPEAFPVGLPSTLLTQRPDILAAQLRLAAADQRVAAAVADRFPSVNLTASYGYAESDFGRILSGNVWSLVGSMVMPLVDWNKRKAEVDRREAVVAERAASYQQTVLRAFQDVEDALVANRTAARAIDRTMTEAEAAGDSLRLAQARYADGLVDYLQVLTAQQAQFDAQIRLLAARRQQIDARIDLARAMGGRWMVELAAAGSNGKETHQ